jgi:RecB family exonuclease
MFITYINEGTEGEENAPSPFLTINIPKGRQINELKVQGIFPSIALPAPNQEDGVRWEHLTPQKGMYVPYIPTIRGIGFLLNSLVQSGVKHDILYSVWDKIWYESVHSSIVNGSVSGKDTRHHVPRRIILQKPFRLPRDYPLSQSKIGTYLECPRKFFYSTILEIETPQSVPMIVGTALHELAQKIHSPRGSQIIYDLELLRDIAKQRLSEHPELFQGDLELEGWSDYIMGRIQDYLDWWMGNPSNCKETEYKFDSMWKEGVRFKGRIDRLDYLSDDKWVINDYKKSGKEQETALINQFLIRDDDFQFPIYYISMKEAYNRDVGCFRLLVFDFNNQREFKAITIPISQEISDKKRKKWVTPDELETVRKRIVKIAEELLSPKTDFNKTAKTQCRTYSGIKCPYVAFCTKSEDKEDAENSSGSE